MLLVATLFSIHNSNTEDLFIRSLRQGGAWHTAARQVVPELVGTDLLRHRDDAPSALFLCLDFWASREAYLLGCQSPAVCSLFTARRALADSSFDFGAFEFAKLPDDMNRRPHCSTNRSDFLQ